MPSDTQTSAAPSFDDIDVLFDRYGPVYKWLATVTSMVAAMTMTLGATTVNVAFPDIMGAFGIGRDQVQLISTGYFAAQTSGMLLSAWLIGAIGERRTFTLAVLAFLVGSAMSGVAESSQALLFGRVLQGNSAGIIMPLGMAVTFKVFPRHQKGLAMGLFAMGNVLAPALGPTLGGLAIDAFSWRYIFLLTIPTAVIALIMGNLFMPSRPLPKKIPTFDFLGYGLLVAALAGVLLGFSHGHRSGWTSAEIIGLFSMGVGGATGFILRQLYGAHPLVNLRVFSFAKFNAAASIGFFTGCAMFSSFFLLPLFTQQIQHFTALNAGLLMIPAGLSLLFLFPLAGRLSDIMPAYIMIYAGMIIFSIAFYCLSTADVNTPFWTLVLFTILVRMGVACTRSVVNAEALKALPADLVNQGSSSVNFVRQLGGTIGTNCLVVFLELRIPFHGDAFAAMQTGANQTTQILRDSISRLLSEGGVAEFAREPGATRFLSDVIYAQASTMGFQDAYFVLALFAALGVIPAWVLSRTKSHAA
ncbi:MAG: DHA2 family efflux MFS transporter permease subunit [Rhodospirillaceae bacterium]|nr:DHA2 family efflux MFS transporter permease subunit [Rhodospirillaceae bacterium]MBT5665548.1 DHA2 family efflux MFS transporter permease subunit [Rhodospirillaceae bacterium]MBT5811548.1 DHA2 family efflux MFS transporter permease subunit [Rhodospirillaceae bacterium]